MFVMVDSDVGYRQFNYRFFNDLLPGVFDVHG